MEKQDKELLGVVTIHKYIRKIQTTKERQATYYFKGENLPIRYEEQLGANYQWIQFKDFKKPVLCDGYGVVVIKNKNVVGTPKYKIINGQDLHTLQLRDYERSKIIKAIKEQMIPEVEKLDIITVKPIRILCELHDTVEDVEINRGSSTCWDLDNRTIFYSKVFQDVLSGSPMINKEKKVVCTSKAIIPNDNILYITQAPSPVFYPIENSEQRKLVFKIYQDKREIIKNSDNYVKKEV